MSDVTQLTVRPKASQQLASLIGMEPGAMLHAIKAQCFRTMRPENVTDEQLAAFVSIAAEMGVNPFLPDMLYAFPGSNGSIIPIMGPSGVYKKLMEHPEVDSWETIVYPEDVSQPATHAVTKIWRKGRERPLAYTALVSEWKVNSNPNWVTRTRHMINLRSLKHAARQIIHGLPYDADDREIMGEINVTPDAPPPEPVAKRADAPARSKKGAAAVVENPSANTQATTKGGTVVEGEFTEGPKATPTPAPDAEKAPEPEKPKERTPAEQKILDDLKAKQEAATKAKAEAAKPAEQKPEGNPTSRTTLADGEVITVNAEIIDVASMMGKFKGNETPLVQAQLKNGFDGLVLHFGGGKQPDPKSKTVTPDALYEVGAVRRFTIRGMKNNLTGRVSHLVDKIEEASQDSATEVG